jgi:glycosyltransferase involved in cell wall biosynthesis
VNGSSDEWVAAFARTRGRPPRVLYLGNVANNAYLTARILEGSGIDIDVLCSGNYSFMASPEWEELEGVAEAPIDMERPSWPASRRERFRRPAWFAQGPFLHASRYLIARREGGVVRTRARRHALETRRRFVAGHTGRGLRWIRGMTARASADTKPAKAAASDGSLPLADTDVDAYAASRGWSRGDVEALLRHYDLVHAYGDEPAMPWVVGKHPYVAWEHGTLRHLPFQPTLHGRVTAASYRDADAVVITNADNRVAAERLGITRFRFLPHPVSEFMPDPRATQALRAELSARLGADFLVFHPSRQHWDESRHPHFEKGNDFLIRALGVFLRERPRAAAVFVDWGATADASRALIAALGIADCVHWIPPQPGRSLARHIGACDVIADQFFLGAFGSTLPRTLYLERAAMIHLDADAHRWCFPELPPVINVQTPDDIAAALRRGYDDRRWLVQLGQQGRRWYDAYHSSGALATALLSLYGELLGVTREDAALPRRSRPLTGK